ncbi:hypothetical protein AZ004_004148, partial [Escherichia coli]
EILCFCYLFLCVCSRALYMSAIGLRGKNN